MDILPVRIIRQIIYHYNKQTKIGAYRGKNKSQLIELLKQHLSIVNNKLVLTKKIKDYENNELEKYKNVKKERKNKEAEKIELNEIEKSSKKLQKTTKPKTTKIKHNDLITIETEIKPKKVIQTKTPKDKTDEENAKQELNNILKIIEKQLLPQLIKERLKCYNLLKIEVDKQIEERKKNHEKYSRSSLENIAYFSNETIKKQSKKTLSIKDEIENKLADAHKQAHKMTKAEKDKADKLIPDLVGNIQDGFKLHYLK